MPEKKVYTGEVPPQIKESTQPEREKVFEVMLLDNAQDQEGYSFEVSEEKTEEFDTEVVYKKVPKLFNRYVCPVPNATQVIDGNEVPATSRNSKLWKRAYMKKVYYEQYLNGGGKTMDDSGLHLEREGGRIDDRVDGCEFRAIFDESGK